MKSNLLRIGAWAVAGMASGLLISGVLPWFVIVGLMLLPFDWLSDALAARTGVAVAALVCVAAAVALRDRIFISSMILISIPIFAFYLFAFFYYPWDF